MKPFFVVILKVAVVVCALIGILLSASDPDAYMGGSSVFLYFTIQSNIWIALLKIVEIVRFGKEDESRTMSIFRLIFTISITLTGLVYCILLAPTMGADAYSLSSVLTHIAVPVFAVTDFFLCRETLNLKSSDAWWVTIPPLYYLVFAGVGYLLNWPFGPGVNYPYFFLNWGSPAGAFGFCTGEPYMGVVYWVLILLVLLVALSRIYICLANFRCRR